MRKMLLATTAVALTAGFASAEDIKIGVILGFTGPIESITPEMVLNWPWLKSTKVERC